MRKVTRAPTPYIATLLEQSSWKPSTKERNYTTLIINSCFYYRKYNYLYPIYFDAEKTSSEGRRLPSSLCKKNPQANDILLAAQSCGLAAELEQVDSVK